MRYNGNFRRNGSGAASSVVVNNDLPRGRDYRQYNATAEDVIALVNGAGFTVRYGKQNLGYFASERQALFEAGRQGATAYKMTREGEPHRATRVILTPIDDEESQTPTAAELIADKIRDQIGVGDAPLSPLAKQRVVLMLLSFCKDKQIAWESFHILYPMALREQFNRLWDNIEAESKPITSKETFSNYAEARGLQDVAEAMIDNDLDACIKACSKCNISSAQFEELYKNSLQNSCSVSEDFYEKVSKHIARDSVERRIDGDIFRMLKNEPYLKSMVASGNEEGIVDYLQSNGYHRREAEEICSEMISLGKLVNRI